MLSYFLCLFNVTIEKCIFITSSAHMRKEIKFIFFPKQHFWREEQNSVFSSLYQLGETHKFSNMWSTCGPESVFGPSP